ncbi:helix-turn-helix domain-containing protein [Actimicrobium sp. CCI2.3]|uniref:helix-turn-helix domain-containing protein n=1 Tax=Actimicrobium sp. CCI2.3 TaxID=3048616 RepID=UPI002AB53B0D|nr:helix-turn-helix domain-containing protein [Actimicrobium sp. CCI2.3]MDY7575103.1 helix-turn-helix domain-containing protein [Actimicrobium sp. CCI2.3]MEB0022556.1 hypothetical protein [Actimicrobium sp. CCI2.3]
MDVRLTSIGKSADGMVISLETDSRPCHCTHCQSPSTVRYGRTTLRVRDLAFDGARIDLDIKRARLRCNVCLKTFNEPVAGVSERHRATGRMVALAAKMVLSESFLSVARQLFLDEKTVRAIFNERLPILRTISRPHHPADVLLWLPLIQGKMRAAWVNPGEGTLIRVDADTSAATLVEAVRELTGNGAELLYLPPVSEIIAAIAEAVPRQIRLHGPSLRAACRKQITLFSAVKTVSDYIERLILFVTTETPDEAARQWQTLLEPPAAMQSAMQPLLQSVQLLGPTCFDDMQCSDSACDLQMTQIASHLVSRFGRRSYEVMLAVMLYDKRLFQTRRTPIQTTGAQLAMGYQKTNFGTSLAKLATRLATLPEEPRTERKAITPPQ